METKIAESMMQNLQTKYDLKINKMDKNGSQITPKALSQVSAPSGSSAKPNPTISSVVESLS